MKADPGEAPRAAIDERSAVEHLIDDILSDSFPASDPPTWDSAARRIERTASKA